MYMLKVLKSFNEVGLNILISKFSLILERLLFQIVKIKNL